MVVDLTRCNRRALSGGLLLLATLGRYHPTISVGWCSDSQYRRVLRSSGDDAVILWQNMGLEEDRDFGVQIGLIGVIRELVGDFRASIPVGQAVFTFTAACFMPGSFLWFLGIATARRLANGRADWLDTYELHWA